MVTSIGDGTDNQVFYLASGERTGGSAYDKRSWKEVTVTFENK